jgi:hypothetical protein
MPGTRSCPPRQLAGRDLEQVSICDRCQPPTAARSSWRRPASSAPPRSHRPILSAALPSAHQEPARSSPAGHGGSPGGVHRPTSSTPSPPPASSRPFPARVAVHRWWVVGMGISSL